jgi:hypothetical protein
MLDRAWSLLLLERRGAAIWTALVIAGFIMLTPLRRCWSRIAGGLLHAFVHMSAVLLCAWLATQLTLGLERESSATHLLQGLLILAMGGALGSMIFGWYLTIMCEAFGVHENGATATQGWSHWKSFLRLRIAPNGDLTLYPIGIAKTPRWAPRGYRKGAGAAVPLDGRADHEIYRLIEEPPVIRARLDQHDVGGRDAAEAGVPRDRVPADVAHRDARADRGRLDGPLAERVVLEAGRADE